MTYKGPARFLLVISSLSVATVLTAEGCGKTNPCRENDPGGFVRQVNGERSGTIIFVHGVWGSAGCTWTNPNTRASFPKLVADDRVFDKYDVYMHGYSSPKRTPALTIDELAENLWLRLDSKEILKSPQIIFVAHSMGGLVIRSMLTKYPNIGRRTKLIYFFATPTEGSEQARLATLLSSNPQLGNMLPYADNTYLANLSHAWLAADLKIESHCGYEKIPTVAGIIVSESSAIALCNTRIDPIQRDHMSIVKPEDTNDLSYIAFRQAFVHSTEEGAKHISVPPNTALGSVLRLLADADKSGIQFTNSCNAARTRTVTPGEATGATVSELMEVIATRVEGEPSPRLNINRTGGIYVIDCH